MTTTRRHAVHATLEEDHRVLVPAAVRRALGLHPGDSLRFVLEAGEIRIERAPLRADEPFATFTEWASDADELAFSDL